MRFHLSSAVSFAVCLASSAVWAGEMAFPVKPLGRFEIAFETETHGYHTTKAYPYLEEVVNLGGVWTRRHMGCPVPYYAVSFRDACGKSVGPSGASETRSVLIREERRVVRVEFRAPPSAAMAVFQWMCPDARDTLVVTNVAFKVIRQPTTLNVNPDFARGVDDFSGWGVGENNDLRPDPLQPGRFMMVCGNRFNGGKVWTDWIPVEPGRSYRLEYNFQQTPDLSDGRSRVLFMTYESAEKSGGPWKGTLRRELAGGSLPRKGVYSFAVPDGVRCIRSLIENTVVRRYALFEEEPK